MQIQVNFLYVDHGLFLVFLVFLMWNYHLLCLRAWGNRGKSVVAIPIKYCLYPVRARFCVHNHCNIEWNVKGVFQENIYNFFLKRQGHKKIDLRVWDFFVCVFCFCKCGVPTKAVLFYYWKEMIQSVLALSKQQWLIDEFSLMKMM